MTNEDTKEVYRIARMIAKEEIALTLKEKEKSKPKLTQEPVPEKK